MQDHRKLEETVFWAGLARSLCELQLTSKPRSLAPNSAENIPSIAKDNTMHFLPVGCAPERHVPDEMQINPGLILLPNLNLLLKFWEYFYYVYQKWQVDYFHFCEQTTTASALPSHNYSKCLQKKLWQEFHFLSASHPTLSNHTTKMILWGSGFLACLALKHVAESRFCMGKNKTPHTIILF